MKVLMISGDKNLLGPNSSAYERLTLQRSAVETLDVYVWPQVHSKWEIYQAARKGHYDVITSQDPFWRGLLALEAGWLARTKVNIQVHADLEGQSFVRHVLAQIVLCHADSIRVVSERIKQQVVGYGARAPVHVLPIYLDLERFRSVVHIPSEEKRLLWVGRFEREKNPVFALRVLRELRQRGIDPVLTMLGKGSLEERLKREAKGLRVQFPGWQDTREYLATADVVISTSPRESWGASIVEALAAGVPVVSLDVGVAKEAGATITTAKDFATLVIHVLTAGTRGKLVLPLYSATEWAAQWKDSLI